MGLVVLRSGTSGPHRRLTLHNVRVGREVAGSERRIVARVGLPFAPLELGICEVQTVQGSLAEIVWRLVVLPAVACTQNTKRADWVWWFVPSTVPGIQQQSVG